MTHSESNDQPELGSMRDGPSPPGSLEDHTVAALRDQGLVRDAPPRRVPRPLIAAAGLAASVALFLLGLAVGRSMQTTAPTTQPQRTFAMLLREPAGWPDQKETARLVAEYGAWAREQGERGNLVAGEKLDNSGRWLRRVADGVESTPAPIGTEQSLPLGGYFMITAAGYDEAVAIAGTCPHLKYGGTIEVRAIDQ